MKSCPKCNRTFPDEGQKFCTFDGGLLIGAQSFDPNATIRATSIDLNAPSERPTSRDLPDQNATIMEDYSATVALPRNTGPTSGSTGTTSNASDIAKPPVPPPPPPVTPPPPPPPAQQSRATTGEIVAPQPAAVAQAPSAPLPPPVAKKKSKLPWILAGILLFLFVGGGALAGVFFFVVKPRLDEMAAERNPNRPLPNANVSTPAPSSSVETPSPSPVTEDAYVPPPGTVQFVNSKDDLDGVLAEHYFDFSFYYPQSWQRDPKSGVPGATNFVKVERRIPPDFTQENFVVRWYPSSGTFEGDLPGFPQRVEEFSTSLARGFPEYRKVSEGRTTINSMQGYEFRWEGLSKGTQKGDLHLWGRVVFVPTGNQGDSAGAILSMFTTSLAPELSSVEDVGEHGETPVILESFRFKK